MTGDESRRGDESTHPGKKFISFRAQFTEINGFENFLKSLDAPKTVLRSFLMIVRVWKLFLIVRTIFTASLDEIE